MSEVQKENKIIVELESRDRIEVQRESSEKSVQFVGCMEMIDLMQTMRRSFGVDVEKWPLPQEQTHTALLLRELILKLRGDWQFPYQEDELCHCRAVRAQTVDQAIIAGAHRTEVVSQQTSAGTACGTCRPDIEKIIEYRLKK